jgi:beta-ureidopropionase
MARTVRCGLIQAANAVDPGEPIEKIKEAMIARHIPLLEQAARSGVQVLCLQELFYGPYFPPSQDARWFGLAEPIPDGPTVALMRGQAQRLGMALVVPIMERVAPGVFYNTAAVIDADGRYLGRYRKNHLPHVAGFWEKFFFKPGNEGYPVFETAHARIGVYLCYDRHFPEGARLLGLNGAEIVFNPSATTAGLSQHLWKLEQPAHAVANGYFIAAINRVGEEAPWRIGRFYGQSYFCDPRGRMVAEAGEGEELLTADLDLDLIEEVRTTWQFFRDRRPETYGDLTKLLP